MADIGHVALILALVAAIYSVVMSVVAARIGSHRLVTSARSGVLVVAGLYTLAVATILYAFATKDFSLKIVAEHASRDLPLVYSISALYADKAGSMFLWGWLISLSTAILALQKHNLHKQIITHAFIVLAVIEAFFLALVTLVVNVFDKIPVPPTDGFGLNPLLQNFGMLIHPPLLYIGFAGFAVVFALVMAALVTRSPSAEWIIGVRRWSIFAWCMLGIGNVVGMWWSYNELGWGGYWAWDPVENAGLMPWLLGTAFLHSIAIRRQRNYLQTWSLVLIIFTFAFIFLSPFITHGGIESPLHGFYGSTFPPYILAAILVTLISSLALLYTRHRSFEKEKKPSSLISREGAFLITNILLVTLVFVIFTGTVLPRIVEALAGVKIAIDRSFFARICGPIMLVLVFFMGICPLFGWGKSSWKSMQWRCLYAFLAVLVISIVILILGIGNWYIAIVIVCGFPLFTIFSEWFQLTKARHCTRKENYIRAFLSLLSTNRARYGGFAVHIGIILIALGAIGSSFYSVESMATLDIGESMRVGEYKLTYDELMLKEDKTKVSAVASISVIRSGRLIASMYPSYDYWFSHMDHFAEVAVRTTPAEDLFVSLMWTSYNPEDKLATFRVLVNPLIIWIWIGGGFLLLGGAVAFSALGGKLPGVER